MGSQSAAYCCQRTTTALSHMYSRHGFEDINYLDDLGAAEEEDRVEEAYDCLGWVLDSIGVQKSKHKAAPPAYVAVFLGILFNTITMTLQITPESLAEIRDLLKEWMNKSMVTLKELQSLLGKLNFAGSMVCSGRVFVLRLINHLKQFPSNGRHLLTREMKKDIEWWLQFMEEFNGITIMPPINWESPDSIISSDASLYGAGGWATGSEAFHCKFPTWLMGRSDVFINELELITIIVCIKVWKDKVVNRNILAYCDNAVSVKVVNTGKAKNRFSQACLREICYLMARANAVIKLVHISSECNQIPDCLSRWRDHKKCSEFWEITDGLQVTFKEVNNKLFEFSHNW